VGIDVLMVPSEQLTDDRRATRGESSPHVRSRSPWTPTRPEAERAARMALRAQVGKLERELSGIVAGRFPHISPAVGAARPAPEATARRQVGEEPALVGGPRLLSLAELERQRDRLALRVREAQGQTVRRDELERDARELLERMRAQPARYKFVRLPVVALGERGCGAWEVRPRLGLIGMLAGWWQLKLSSGCPLARGSRGRATPSHR
jgi:hypothetical protein